jgi:hypothetical protein
MMTRFAYFAMTRAVSKPIPFRDVPVMRTGIFCMSPSFIFHSRKQGKNIPFLPLISSENAVATSSAVVANENTGTADIVLLVFERVFNWKWNGNSSIQFAAAFIGFGKCPVGQFPKTGK